jgi:hypothetical protein
MAARAEPRARYWAAAAIILMVLLASAFFFWLGIPLLVLWGLSKATVSTPHHFVLGVIGVPLGMAAFAPVLLWLNGLYLRVTAMLPIEQPRPTRRGGRRGPLEPMLLLTLFVAFVAMLIWFFFFAHNPPRQVI